MAFKFELGQVLKDIVTGFQGVVVARTQYLTGCNRYSLQGQKLKDGKPREWEAFDETVLVPVKKKTIKPIISKQPEIAKKEKGGPAPKLEQW